MWVFGAQPLYYSSSRGSLAGESRASCCCTRALLELYSTLSRLLLAFLDLSQCYRRRGRRNRRGCRDSVQVHRSFLVVSLIRAVLSCLDGSPSGLCSLVHIT